MTVAVSARVHLIVMIWTILLLASCTGAMFGLGWGLIALLGCGFAVQLVAWAVTVAHWNKIDDHTRP